MRAVVLAVLMGPGVDLSAQVDALPELNRRVLEFTRAHLGLTVDRGECWDLAAVALDSAGARWDHDLAFGRMVDPRKEVVLPGDIIQLEGAEFKWKEGNTTYGVTMPHHTAIIYEVRSAGRLVIAHQNMEGIGRKVGLGELVLDGLVKGSAVIHRPVH